MGFYATEPLPVMTDPRPKTRVGGSRTSLAARARRFSSQALEPRQETVTLDSTTVSGVVEWLSNDPIGISGGLDQYVFCANNPVNFTDPNGLDGFLDPVIDLGRVAKGVGLGIGVKFVYDQWQLNHGGLQGLVGVTYFGTWTFFGRNFDNLGPAAKEIIESHEARHRAGMGEECARKGTIYDVDFLLQRGEWGQFLGQGGTPLTPEDINELQTIKMDSVYWLQRHQKSYWQRTKEAIWNIIY